MYFAENMLKRVLLQESGLLVLWAGELYGIANGIRIFLLSVYLSLFNAIMYNLGVLLLFGVAPLLLVNRAGKYLVLYGLSLFAVSRGIFHSFLPATLLLLAAATMHSFRRVD